MQRKRIALSLSGGLLAELVNKISPLLILHFATRAIGVQGFGVAQFGLWLLDFAVFFIYFGYQDIGTIEIGKRQNDAESLKKIIGETLLLRIGHMVLAIVALVTCIQIFPGYRSYAAVLTALGFMLITSTVDMTFVLIGTQRMPVVSALMIIGKVASLVGIIYTVDGSEDAIRYAVLSAAANGFVSVASAVYALAHFGIAKPDIVALKRRLLAATPYAIRIFLILALERFDMFVVEHYTGQMGTGLYAGPARLVQSIVPLTITISTVFFSEMVAVHESEMRQRHLWMGLRLMILAFLPIVCGVWFVDDALMDLIFGDEFRQVGTVLSILMLTIVGQILIQVFGYQVLLLEGRIVTLNRILGVGAVFGALLAIILVSQYGLVGGAIANVTARLGVGFFLLMLCRDTINSRSADPLLRAIAPSACMVAALVLMANDNFYVTILVGAISYFASAATFNYRELRTILLLLRRRIA